MSEHICIIKLSSDIYSHLKNPLMQLKAVFFVRKIYHDDLCSKLVMDMKNIGLCSITGLVFTKCSWQF